jgi:hypothetical protein
MVLKVYLLLLLIGFLSGLYHAGRPEDSSEATSA